MICDIEMLGETYASGTKSMMRFHVELQGEVQDTAQGEMKFTKGISAYPGVGSIVHQIRSVDLAAIYAATGAVNAFVGELSQDNTIPALVDISRYVVETLCGFWDQPVAASPPPFPCCCMRPRK